VAAHAVLCGASEHPSEQPTPVHLGAGEGCAAAMPSWPRAVDPVDGWKMWGSPEGRGGLSSTSLRSGTRRAVLAGGAAEHGP